MRKTHGIAAVMVVVAGVLGAVQPVSAAEPLDQVTVPLELAYFDEAVAAQNGFKIVTKSDGSQDSVPVTAEARNMIAKQARHTVIGPCGESSLTMSRVGGTRQVHFTTTFAVKAPTVYHNWNVDLTRQGKKWSHNLSGGPTRGTWGTSRITNTGNNQGVRGEVRAGSHALLVNGAVCYSGGPNSGT